MFRYGVLAAVVWVVGLVTAVPLAVYYLLFHAPREQYALLITFILAWPFGYWPIVGPILMLLKLRSVYRGLQQVTSADDLRRKLSSAETEDVVIDWIALEYHLPRFLARRAYRYVRCRMVQSGHGKNVLDAP
jgi:hypothetical protein